MGTSLKQARGLTWVDGSTVATLGVLEGTTLRPTILSVGGEVRLLAEVPDGKAITATGGERDLWVVTTRGRLLGHAGSQWLDSGPASDLAVPAG